MPSAEREATPTLAAGALTPPHGTVAEARRVMTVCNACRYCEGLCAVFPAMERLAAFADSDLRYLANVCHDCRACYYGCQYAPPHEFGVNVPEVFAGLRRESYERFAWPRALGRAFRRNGLAVALAAGAAGVLVPSLAVLLWSSAAPWSGHSGEGAFYAVVPYPLMVLPASLVGVLAALAFTLGGLRFWRESGPPDGVAARDFGSAALHALRMTYLGGDGGGGTGDGCTYPGEGFSNLRKRLHHFVFWGFGLDLASTSVAAFYHHAAGRLAPYPLLSLPVLLGTLGGVLLVIGATGLLWLERGQDPRPADAGAIGMDVGFLTLLMLTSLSGLALLALRETPAMGALLVVHLGIVAGFFVTLPYGKLVHAVYRYLALVRSAVEERVESGPRA